MLAKRRVVEPVESQNDSPTKPPEGNHTTCDKATGFLGAAVEGRRAAHVEWRAVERARP